MSAPENVVQALAAVMTDLPGIGKAGQAAAQQGGYKYRGIEQITAEVQKRFAKYGVVVVPRVKHRLVNDIEVNGKPWTDTYLEVDWAIYGPGGLEDRIDATTFGHGRDNSDKGTNKAMTQAFKYLLLDMLCISDPADDNDGTNQAADARSRPEPEQYYQQVNGETLPLDVPMAVTRSEPATPDDTHDVCSPKQANYAKALLTGAGITEDQSLAAWFRTNIEGAWPGTFNNLSKAQASRVIELLRP